MTTQGILACLEAPSSQSIFRILLYIALGTLLEIQERCAVLLIAVDQVRSSGHTMESKASLSPSPLKSSAGLGLDTDEEPRLARSQPDDGALPLLVARGRIASRWLCVRFWGRRQKRSYGFERVTVATIGRMKLLHSPTPWGE